MYQTNCYETSNEIFRCVEIKICFVAGGRVVAQPQEQQPVKAIPLPYNPDCPPPYQACVSGNSHPQQFGGTKQQMPGMKL